MGPRIIAQAIPETEPPRSPDEGATGIRRRPSGWWCAIVNGRLVGEWIGPGSKLQAIRTAGTNKVLA